MTAPFPSTPATPLAVGPPVDLGQAWGWYVRVGKYIFPRKLELAVRYGVLDPSTKQKDDLTKEFGAAINYSFDGTYNNRLVIDNPISQWEAADAHRTGSRSKANRDSVAISSKTGSMCIPVLFLDI